MANNRTFSDGKGDKMKHKQNTLVAKIQHLATVGSNIVDELPANPSHSTQV